jgi:hypothetical protein
MDPAVVAHLLGRTRPDEPVAALTDRERAVLELMAEGLRTPASAAGSISARRPSRPTCTRSFTKLDLAPAPDDHRRVLAVLAFPGP